MATCQSNTIHSAHTIEQHRLFLHAEFRPRGIPRRTIRQLYNRTLAKTKLFDDFIVAYHRPKNFPRFVIENKTAELPLGSVGEQTCELHKISVKLTKNTRPDSTSYSSVQLPQNLNPHPCSRTLLERTSTNMHYN
jgi:hypothetical protein